MRHAHFPIDRAASERWLAHMRASLDEQALPAELDMLLWDYFEAAAPAMINTDGVAQASIAMWPGCAATRSSQARIAG